LLTRRTISANVCVVLIAGCSAAQAGELSREKLDEANADMRRASFWARRLEFGRAVEASSQAITLCPDVASFYAQRADFAAKTFDFTRAMDDYHQAIKLAPQTDGYWREMGKLCQALGHDDEALKALSRSIELSPKEVGGYMARENVYEHHGQFDKAIDDLKNALKYDARRSQLYEKLGKLLLKEHRYEEAIQVFSACIKLAPDLPASYYGRADAYSALNKSAEAQRDRDIGHKLDAQY
jgi:tetratricopeptide (TPR) repeat protein